MKNAAIQILESDESAVEINTIGVREYGYSLFGITFGVENNKFKNPLAAQSAGVTKLREWKLEIKKNPDNYS